MRGELDGAGLGGLLGQFPDDATGSIQIDGPSGPAQVFLRDGHIYWATSPAPRAQLGQRLLGAGFIDEEELAQALEVQSSVSPRPRLGTVLVERGLVSPDVIRVFVQEQVLDALLEIASWERGGYEFFDGDAASEETPVLLPTHHITTEVERRQREWEEISHVVPSLDHVPDFVGGSSTAQAALEPDEFTLMTNVDGRRSVRELALDLGYNEYEAARLVYGLSVLGVIELTEPTARTERTSVSMDIARGLEEAIFGTTFGATAADVEEAPVEPADEPAVVEDEEDLAQALEDAIASVSARGPSETAPSPPPSQTAPPPDARHAPTDERLLLPDDGLEPEVWTYVIEADDVDDDAFAAAEGVGAAEEPVVPDEVHAEQAVAELEDAAGEVELAEPQVEERGEEPSPYVADADEEAEPEPYVARIGDAPSSAASSDARRELSSLLGELDDIEEATREPAEEPQEPAAERPAAPAAADEDDEEPDRGEVSEFLRELSRLAGDDDESSGPPPSPPRSPPPAPEKRGEEPQKGGFRRLFGGR